MVPEHPAPHWRAMLQVMPPWVRITTGALMLALGGPLLAFGSLAGFLGLAGLPLLCDGWRDAHHRRTDAAELARARVELEAIRPGVRDAVQRRRDVDRLLRDLGYTSAKARRWIALECDVVLPRGER
jgi:hypothetical protein